MIWNATGMVIKLFYFIKMNYALSREEYTIRMSDFLFAAQTRFIHSDNIGVDKFSPCTSSPAEGFPDNSVGFGITIENSQRNINIKIRVVGAVHDTHPAFT